MTSFPPKSQTLRSNLMLSASVLTTALVAYGRPVEAQASCDLTGPNTYTCSGNFGSPRTLGSTNTPITVNVDAPATFQFFGGQPSLSVIGTQVEVNVAEGVTLQSGVAVQAPVGVTGSDPTGIEVNFDGAIDAAAGSVSGSAGIDVLSRSGDMSVVTGAGDIDLSDQRAVGIRVRSDEQEGDRPVAASVTTGAGTIYGTGGISVAVSGDVSIATGAGGLSTEKYGVRGLSKYGNMSIVTGSGAIAVTPESANSRPGPTIGVHGLAGFKYLPEGPAKTDITIGSGGVSANFGVIAVGGDVEITVNGDITVDEMLNGDGAGILTSNWFFRQDRQDENEVTIDDLGTSTITLSSGTTLDASAGGAGIYSKYGNTDITVSGTIIGGRAGAIQTNIYYDYGAEEQRLLVGKTRVELREGYDITGDVIAGGNRTDDVLALGGDGDVSLDVGLIDNTQLSEPRFVDESGNGSGNDIINLAVEDEKQYFNFDEFEKVGSGTGTIFGENEDIDNFTVREGTLELGGVVAEQMAIEIVGGAVTGEGFVGSLMARSGTTIAPGNSNAPATIEVAGDLDMEAGSTLSVNLNDTGASDLVQVGGAAKIASGADLEVVADAGDYSTGDLEWTVVAAEGGVTGTFDEVSDNLVDVDFVDVYDGDTVKLTATVTTGSGVLGDGDDVSDKTNGPAAAASAGYSGMNFAAVLADVPQRSGSAPVVSMSSKSITAMEPPVVTPTIAPSTDMTLFFGTFNEKTTIEANNTGGGFEANSVGFLGGASYDGMLDGGVAYQLNAALGYSQTAAATFQGATDATDVHVGVGGTVTRGPLTLNGAIGYSTSTIELSRRVGTMTAMGETEARTLSGVIEASYDLAMTTGLPEGATLAPLLRVRGYSTSADAYTETGAGALGLNVGGIDSSAVYAGIGLRYEGDYAMNGMSLRPNLSLVYDNKMSGEATSGVSTITGVQGAFDTTVSTGPDQLFSVDAGFAMDIKDNVEGFANFGATFGDDFQSQRGTVGLTIKF